MATLFVTVAGSLGAFIYPDYRNHLKQALFVHTPRIGWLFERKEHLGLAAVIFAWAGDDRASHGAEIPDRVVARCDGARCSLLLRRVVGDGVIVGILGIIVASHSTF